MKTLPERCFGTFFVDTRNLCSARGLNLDLKQTTDSDTPGSNHVAVICVNGKSGESVVTWFGPRASCCFLCFWSFSKVKWSAEQIIREITLNVIVILDCGRTAASISNSLALTTRFVYFGVSNTDSNEFDALEIRDFQREPRIFQGTNQHFLHSEVT